eukprot:48611_1
MAESENTSAITSKRSVRKIKLTIKKDNKHQSNTRKRKRNVSENDSELLLKKRKLNDDRNVNDLLYRIQILTNQNKELKQQMNDYKAKYLNLLNQMQQEMEPIIAIKTKCERIKKEDPNDSTLSKSCSLEPSSLSAEEASERASQATIDNPSNVHKQEDCDATSTSKNPDANPENDVDFDDSYHFSVSCHRCNQHFDDVREYREHLKSHYDNCNTNGKVTQYRCDLDPKCNAVTNPYNFVHHIASHTKNYAWKCNQCDHSASTKSNLKKHWKRAHGKHDINCDTNQRSRKKRKPNKLPDSAPVILCSALTTDQMVIYERFKKEFKHVARFVTKWNENVTHLITSAIMKDGGKLLATTMKYYQSIVAGCWVLCFDWVEKCLVDDELCNKGSYEVQEDRIARDGCRKAREMRNKENYKGLFSNVTVFIASALKHTKLDDGLRKLFKIGGAEVMNMSILDITEIHTKELVDRNMVFVCDKTDNGLTTAQELVCAKFGIVSIGFQDVFDAISNYSRIDKRLEQTNAMLMLPRSYGRETKTIIQPNL